MATDTEKFLAGALIAVIITAVIIVTLIAFHNISNVGKISAVGFDIFQDAACTMNLTIIDWGTLHPGEMAAAIMFARNSGNVNVTLGYNVTGWTPVTFPIYFILAWNYTGYILHPFEVSAIMWTLTVSPAITNITDFSFNINCTAKEVT